MVSAVGKAKRVLVTLLKSLAGIYALVLGLTRDSTEVEVKAAYRKVSRRAHPDRGGTPEHQKALNAARDEWEEALRASKGSGGNRAAKKPQSKTAPSLAVDSSGDTAYRFQGLGVLLTYQKFSDTGCWQAFLDQTRTGKRRKYIWQKIDQKNTASPLRKFVGFFEKYQNNRPAQGQPTQTNMVNIYALGRTR